MNRSIITIIITCVKLHMAIPCHVYGNIWKSLVMYCNVESRTLECKIFTLGIKEGS